MASEVGELKIALSFDDKQFNTAMKNMEKVSGDSADKTKSKWEMVADAIRSDVAIKAFGAVTSAVKNFAKDAVSVGMSFEKSMSNVAAISGISKDAGNDLEILTEKAREMGRTTVWSASDAADAMSYMAMAGWKTNDMVDGLAGVMNLATAGGTDLATTSDIVTDALTAFGLSAKDSGRLADVMAAASSNANTNVEMMGETFKYVAPVAGAMGYSIEDTSVAIGLMANAGIKASQAGTSLRSIFTRMAAPTADSEYAMRQLGISITNVDGSMRPLRDVMGDLRKGFENLSEAEQAEYAKMLAGQEAMSGMLAIVNASDADFGKLTEAIDGSNGAAKTMADTMGDNLEGKVAELRSKVEELMIKGFDKLEPVLEKVVEVLGWCADNADTLIPILGVLAGVIGTVFVADKIISFGKKATSVFNTVGKGAKNLGEKFSGVFKKDIGQTASTEAGKSVEKVKTSLASKITTLGTTFSTLFQQIGSVLSSAIGAVMEPIKTLLRGVGEALAGFFTALADPMIAVGAAMFTAAAAAIAAAILMIGAAIGVTMPTWEALFNNIIMPTAVFIRDTVLALIDSLTNNLIRLTNEALIPLGNFIVGSFLSIVNQVTDAIIRFTQQAVIPLVNTLSGALMGILDRVANFLNSTLKTAFDGVKGIVDSVGDAFKKMGDVVVNALNGVNGILSTFKDLLLGVADAIVAVVALATGHSVDYGRGFAHISKAASGGRVGGVGTATSDSNLFALSKGEYVIKASSARKIGYDALDQMNSQGEIALENGAPNWSGLLAAALAEEFEMGEISTGGERPINNQQTIIVNDDMDIRKVGNAFLQEIRRVA